MSKPDKPTRVLKPIIPIDKELHWQAKIYAVTHKVNLGELAEGMLVHCLELIDAGKVTVQDLAAKSPSKTK